ncbi:MAG: AmmeMemoRadiSam system protein B [Arenicellales bacterium]
MEHSSQQWNKTLRPPAVAGSFYPDDRKALARLVDRLLISAQSNLTHENFSKFPKALIVPHAGYRYSGEVAASAYATLQKISDRIMRVILIGPAHRVNVRGMGITGADYFASPLGRIPVDTESVKKCIDSFKFLSVNNQAHQEEHSLETQLPFLQRCLGRIRIVPIVVGSATPEQVEQCLALLWGGEETLVLISSDLSHFLPYQEATRIDESTSKAILNLNPDAIGYDNACGQIGVRGLLRVARRKDMRVRQLDVRNSGDTSGRKDQVVGYGSYAFYDD